MIISKHFNPIPLWWNGKTLILEAGGAIPKAISGFDDDIEKWFKTKFGNEIELAPEPEEIPTTQPKAQVEEVPEAQDTSATPDQAPVNSSKKK